MVVFTSCGFFGYLEPYCSIPATKSNIRIRLINLYVWGSCIKHRLLPVAMLLEVMCDTLCCVTCVITCGEDAHMKSKMFDEQVIFKN